jgi:hypothetical protein
VAITKIGPSIEFYQSLPDPYLSIFGKHSKLTINIEIRSIDIAAEPYQENCRRLIDSVAFLCFLILEQKRLSKTYDDLHRPHATSTLASGTT